MILIAPNSRHPAQRSSYMKIQGNRKCGYHMVCKGDISTHPENTTGAGDYTQVTPVASELWAWWNFSILFKNGLPINSVTSIKGSNRPHRCTDQPNPCCAVFTHRPNTRGGNRRARQNLQTSLSKAKSNNNATTNPVNYKGGTIGNVGETIS